MNQIRRSHELDLHHLHRHAAEEEGFGGGCSVRAEPTWECGVLQYTPAANETERECSSPSPPYVAHGPPFIC